MTTQIPIREATPGEFLALVNEGLDEFSNTLVREIVERESGLILVEDLRIGMRIKEGRNKPFKVHKVETCGSQWRTHLHVNGTMCYWREARIRVV